MYKRTRIGRSIVRERREERSHFTPDLRRQSKVRGAKAKRAVMSRKSRQLFFSPVTADGGRSVTMRRVSAKNQ